MTRLEEIYRQYYAPLVDYLIKKRGASEQDAEDIAIETLLKFHEHVGNIEGLLLVGAKNALIDKQRSHSRHAASHKELFYLMGEAEEETILIETIVVTRLYAAIKRLSPKTRSVIILFIQGLTVKEIASHLHVTYRTALNQYARAVKLMKKYVSTPIKTDKERAVEKYMGKIKVSAYLRSKYVSKKNGLFNR